MGGNNFYVFRSCSLINYAIYTHALHNMIIMKKNNPDFN